MLHITKSMKSKLDVYLRFPIYPNSPMLDTFEQVLKQFHCVEDFEASFGIDLSCGDGKFFDDFWKWTDSGDSLYAVESCETMEKYDGKICVQSLPRFKHTKQLLTLNKDYRFTVKYSKRKQQQVCLIDNKQTSKSKLGICEYCFP